MLFYLTMIVVVAIDQTAKRLVRSFLAVGDTVPVWKFIEFTHYENSGMAHGLFQGYARLFAVMAALFVAGVFYYRAKGELQGRLMELSTGLLVGGAIGNGIDRALFGRVTDFLVFQPRSGIMNLADIAISLGTLLLIIGTAAGFLRKKS